ncbi:RNA recognition motif containing protein [Nitzschia inconspicua]|uniref:RNA recognition motif containing protein n=2 Tax=Nitzschia inconspicua TaxID=303405 RepID=A0A9K3PU72_9STRA|nr:RNA recognition motif containing protein [Nitzschia inconspicua]
MSYDNRRRERSRSRERDDGSGSSYMNGMRGPAMVNLPQLPAFAMVGSVSSNILKTAQQAAQEKINRELFVGNTPPGTSEMLLLQFLNGAMRRVNLCGPHETPILNCRVNTKFAFIELSSSEMANNALNLNGIPFLGAVLKVSRPSKYAGPPIPSKTWQELTGQTLPTGAVLDAEQEKINRELFVGNTTPEMTEQMLRDFLGNAMEQVGLNIMPGNPITACRVSGKFAFVELRTPEEAANALNLNNIPFMGAQLRVGRPSKWNGPPDNHGNWEDILAKYMSGELQAGKTAPGEGAAVMSAAATASGPTPTRVVELQHMLTHDDLVNDDEYNDILEDTREECAQYGQLISVHIPRAGEAGATKIYLEYSSSDDAAKAVKGLEGRTFDGRLVQATYFDETKFAKKEFMQRGPLSQDQPKPLLTLTTSIHSCFLYASSGRRARSFECKHK